jgi:hypothetical protein
VTVDDYDNLREFRVVLRVIAERTVRDEASRDIISIISAPDLLRAHAEAKALVKTLGGLVEVISIDPVTEKKWTAPPT